MSSYNVQLYVRLERKKIHELLLPTPRRYYESLYDTADYLNVIYPPNLSPEEQLEYESEAAKVPLPFSR